STFLSAVSRARPKVADYPFTTLHPNLGVIRNDEADFVLADIPGLIAGAHQGAGLGDRFLGHVERCGVLLHLVDGTQEDPVAAWRTVRQELEAYGGALAEKPEVLALNKTDALDEETIRTRQKALAEASGEEVHPISGISGRGVKQMLRLLQQHIRAYRTAEAEEDAARQQALEELTAQRDDD
ncbi:MAG: GTPase, partial [Pseudomonadota bacterium]